MGKVRKILCCITIITLLTSIPSYPLMAAKENSTKAITLDTETTPAPSTPTPACSQYEPTTTVPLTPPPTVPSTPPPTMPPTPTALPTTSAFVTEQHFPDLESAEWARSAIIFLAQAKVINGYEDGTFRPDNNITRAEFAKMLAVAFDIYNPHADSSFSDIPEDAWYNSYVGSIQNEGLAQGSGGNMFNPDDTITREEMFTFCARTYESIVGKGLVTSGSEIDSLLYNFVDEISISDWARTYVATLIKYQLVTGSPVGDELAIYPLNPITRAEVAVVLNRAINPDEAPTPTPPTTTTATVPPTIKPSLVPISTPTNVPSALPTTRPSQTPTVTPTMTPTMTSEPIITMSPDGNYTCELFWNNSLIKILSYNGTDNIVDIPETILGKWVVKIGANAFNSTNLTSVTIPSHVFEINCDAFINSPNLTEINVAADNSDYSSENGILFSGNVTLVTYPRGKSEASYTFTNNIHEIATHAFYGSKLTELTIPDEITYIRSGAFAYSTGLTKLRISQWVYIIESKPFEGCSNLTIYGENNSKGQWLANRDGIPYVVDTWPEADDKVGAYMLAIGQVVSKGPSFNGNKYLAIDTSTIGLTESEKADFLQQMGGMIVLDMNYNQLVEQGYIIETSGSGYIYYNFTEGLLLSISCHSTGSDSMSLTVSIYKSAFEGVGYSNILFELRDNKWILTDEGDEWIS